MSTLLNRLQTEHGDNYNCAITPVVIEEETQEETEEDAAKEIG